MSWSENGDVSDVVGVMVKEKLCEQDVGVRTVSVGVMAVVFYEDVRRLTCKYSAQSGWR